MITENKKKYVYYKNNDGNPLKDRDGEKDC